MFCISPLWSSRFSFCCFCLPRSTIQYEMSFFSLFLSHSRARLRQKTRNSDAPISRHLRAQIHFSRSLPRTPFHDILFSLPIKRVRTRKLRSRTNTRANRRVRMYVHIRRQAINTYNVTQLNLAYILSLLTQQTSERRPREILATARVRDYLYAN